MSSKEQKVSLIMQRHDLPPLELWQRGEYRLEHPADEVPEAGDEPVEYEFGVVWTGAGVSLPA